MARQLRQLRTLIARHARPDGTTAIDGVLLSSADTPREPRTATSGTVFALIAQGAKRLGVGDHVYDYRAGQCLMASVDVPVTGHYTQASPRHPALGFGLVLRPATTASLLLEIDPGTSRRIRAAPSALGVGDAGPELLDAVIRMVALLDAPSDRTVPAPMLEREIMWRLLTGPLGPTLQQIGRAEKQLRLHNSRLRLITGVDDVATVGFQIGYDSISHFSREYRRKFGLPPGQDAARLRADVPMSAIA